MKLYLEISDLVKFPQRNNMNKIGFFPLLLFLQAVTCLRHFHNGRPKDGFLGVPNVRFDGDLPKDQWITQKLDHFNDADLRTWEQVK
ncbi:hypothetical protein HOLleu_27337 [Holothuria leucospilota]|uniref:Uncharacterized protein n=1 Tax=Holothuria leucospilota TaxID=206669 RepID=A0A9Q1H3F4_HOLLE|nr:hypothetical protein HOLleu_27337 [Holothuria leucospilota]